MRIPRLALMAGALASVLFAGTAHAATVSAPAYKPVLAKNPIYKTGKLGYDTCDEPKVERGTLEEIKNHFEVVLDCLNEAWEPVVKKAGFTFSKPSVQVITKPGAQTGCGPHPGPQGFSYAQAMYCPTNKKITFLATANLVEEKNDLALMANLAHEYSHHIQQLTGMIDALTPYSRKNQAKFLDERRRLELQAECLAGVFIGSVWHSLHRQETDFTYLVKNSGTGHGLSVIGVGGKTSGEQTHGSSTNPGRWLKRGYDTESAGGCNTWKAPKSQVS
ncbi:hypothetical protein SAMN05444920_102698 [Nonomuraea solani]|uniref:Neutral zinc metallopeptidase n=1 Tax=Nonomuraea solani TaxID=1144553 RepID=A0A1H5ZH28_9ACTN|nr:neutral zinc metallopeptidase [Nonomuraea solani]SEG35768.1 hypothetical protein SAMN05444920_102698 [Nonomuraea solani]